MAGSHENVRLSASQARRQDVTPSVKPHRTMEAYDTVWAYVAEAYTLML